MFQDIKTNGQHSWNCKRARRPIRLALNSGFCNMKRLGILLLPPWWDASPSQGCNPPALWSPLPIYTPGWRETMWSKDSCLRKQHDDRGQLRLEPLTARSEVQCPNHFTTTSAQSIHVPSFNWIHNYYAKFCKQCNLVSKSRCFISKLVFTCIVYTVCLLFF